MDEVCTPNSYEERQKKIAKELKKLPSKNPIVQAALKRKKSLMGEEQAWKKFEVVDDLVSAARKQVSDGEGFSESIMALSEALKALVDSKGKRSDNDEADE